MLPDTSSILVHHGRFPRSFHVVVKPLGSRCNLNCAYCYYLHKENLLPETAAGQIADDLLEEFIRQYVTGQEVERVVFNWHGGEPTLLGLDFFRKVMRIQQQYAGTIRIDNDLQTNAVLLDESWCEFLKEHGFRVGLSIDGPKQLHDLVRVSKGGSPTFDQVFRAARLLRQYDVPFNALTVVSSANARHPIEVYRFLTEELGCRRLQWLPCVTAKNFTTVASGRWDSAGMPVRGTAAARPGHPTSVVTDWSVDPDDWGEFLCQFDLWSRQSNWKNESLWTNNRRYSSPLPRRRRVSARPPRKNHRGQKRLLPAAYRECIHRSTCERSIFSPQAALPEDKNKASSHLAEMVPAPIPAFGSSLTIRRPRLKCSSHSV